MNRYLWRAFLAATILSVVAPVKAAMMSGRAGPSSGMSARNQFAPSGGFRRPFFDHDRDFDHHRFFHRDRSFFFFNFGFPFYYYPDYYYYYPPPYYYGPDYYYPSYSYNGGSYSAPVDRRTYLQLGHDWAKDLRLDIVTWDQFVTYVKAYIVDAPAGARDDFRRGFVAGYGENGGAAIEKALKDASASAANGASAQPSNSGQNHY